MTDPVRMELLGVRLELPTNTPVLLLREPGTMRHLPIWIGRDVAQAIALALDGFEPPRPLTHDLLLLVTAALGATVDRITITELRAGTFYADLTLVRDGQEITVSARPSDAIALAARTEAPLFASRAVLDEAAVEIHEDGEEDEIERFRAFLETVSPEDFQAES